VTWRLGRYALAAVMVAIGVTHFVTPRFFVEIMPAYLPTPLALVYLSGVFEVLGGVGLLLERTRRYSAWGLIALYVAVFPANINMAVNEITPTGFDPIPAWLLWARLPLQLVFIAWAWLYTRPRGRAESEASQGARS
jgi:uncharacterized membrane protein